MRDFPRRAAIGAFWLLVWQLAAMAVDNSILLAGPAAVLRSLGGMALRGEFWLALATSLLRIGGGFFLGFLAAALLALPAHRFPGVRALLAPPVALMKTVPVASFVILLLIWTSSRYLSTAISFLVVLPQLYLSLLAGLESADRRLLEMARVFRVPGRRRFWYLYRPALAPHLLSACRVALGMCWKSGVAAEVIGVPAHTIGEGFYLSKVNLDIPGLLAWTAALLCLSWLFERAVLCLLGRFFRLR